MIKRIHHINFVVHNLEQSAERFARLLAMPVGEIESLPQRGVELVRFKLGEVWLILVHPVDPESVPAKYLARHGEGFFLMSWEVDDVQASAREFSVMGVDMLQGEPRRGLDGWRVMDLDPRDLFGINIQLVEASE
jgi:methylmalonyl-CoA/ethylmalonyl-CoA epimerase